jgi:hypothetical protein
VKRLLSFLSAVTLLVALAPDGRAATHVVWHRALIQSVSAVAVATNGSIYAAGRTQTGSTNIQTAATLVKLTSSGATVWTRSWRPFPSMPARYAASATTVAVATNGTVYLAGAMTNSHFEGAGWFIRAYSPSGTLLHAFVSRRLTPKGPWDPQYVSDIAVRGNLVVVAGSYFGCCGLELYRDGWVRAFDPGLHAMWRTQFEPPAPMPRKWYDDATGVSIGAAGNVFASGWAATRAVSFGDRPPDGTLILTKLKPNGTVAWTHRPGVALGYDAKSSLSVRGYLVMVAAPHRDAESWVGRFNIEGSLAWARTWGHVDAAAPTDVAVDASLRTWVVGTKKDRGDGGTDVFLIRYGPRGFLLGSMALEDGVKRVEGGGVAPFSAGAYVSGTTLTPTGDNGGHLWSVAT